MKLFKYLPFLALGLAVSLGAAEADAERLTYSKDVAPIFNDNCVACHRPGQIAPMSLQSYDEVRPWVKSIVRNVADRTMPPWQAQPHEKYTFSNDRSLSAEDRETILAWARQGASRGNVSDLPPAPEFPSGEWKLGEPDFIVTLPEVEIPAEGPDIFKNLPGKVMLPEDKWLTAVEILPGNPKVVHHMITFQVKGFNVEPEEGWLGAWAAGTAPMVFPEGTGRILKKGSSVIGDMHYHPCGTVEKDITRIGLHFGDEADIEKELVNLWVMNTRFEIPAGAANHEVRSNYSFLQDSIILGFAPHMHYRGKDFTYTATYPDGTSEILLAVDNYDFNWQTNYVLNERIEVPKGTRIECVAHFDNSADNPANPDPTRSITFGDESYDEMMIGFIDYVVKDGLRPPTAEELRARYREELLAAHPGEIYGLYRGDKDDSSPMHLPRQGDGVMFLNINNNFTEMPIYDIVWTGNDFTAKTSASALGEATLIGSVDAAGKLRSEVVFTPEIRADLDGELLGSD